jgi:23S rRNA U2552 (ribose-2'-O)-methylase RlmE/FtsJ
MNMNLFHQLEDQAIQYALSVCNSAGNCVADIVDGEEVIFTFNQVIRQKLVELVVKECLDIMEDEREFITNYVQNHAISDAMCNIKSHFGIK